MARPDGDSRLKGYFGYVTHPTMPLERCYCTVCGAPKGWVTQDSSEFIELAGIIVVCDTCERDLREKTGQPIPLLPCNEIEEVSL